MKLELPYIEQKELIELAHTNKLIEIEEEKKAKKEIENLKFENEKSIIRLRRASIKYTQENRWQN